MLPDKLIEIMIDPEIKLGTSTPKTDPAGDYAWELFRKADKIRPGAFDALERKALQLMGGPNAPTAPPGRAIYGLLVAEGKADIFLTYCTGALEAQKQNAAMFILSSDGQRALARYGFAAPLLPP